MRKQKEEQAKALAAATAASEKAAARRKAICPLPSPSRPRAVRQLPMATWEKHEQRYCQGLPVQRVQLHVGLALAGGTQHQSRRHSL